MSQASFRQELDRLSVVIIVVALLTLAGGYLLLSAAESLVLVDGAVEWQAESPLRAVVQLLCLNYQFPTINAGDVKGYVLGIGTGIAAAALGLAALGRARNSKSASPMETSVESFDDSAEPDPPSRSPLLAAAQVLTVLFVLWSFASARWSQAPDIAVGGSCLLAIQILWALVLANSVTSSGVRYIVRGFLIITLFTSIVAVWYYYGRNPTLRAKFPFGNPTFLSASLIPGITLALAWICHTAGGLPAKTVEKKTGITWFWIIVVIAAAVVGLWAFSLADSRGAQVGLAGAILALPFFALRGWKRLIPVALALVVAAFAWFYFSQTAKSSLLGRGDTLRLRSYSWRYAADMFADRPITGHGQGGFALLGDSFVSNDILSDPLVFDGRIDHAHNEWLETVADLGVVGLVLILAVLVLTLAGCLSRIRKSDLEHRWCLIGLAAALVGLCIEELAGVGLRVSEVPIAFYSVLGLAWAGGLSDRSKLLSWSAASSWRGLGLGAACILAALGALLMTQIDFQSARESFKIDRLANTGELDKALESTERGLWRLSPQRSLFSRHQVAETYVRWGERIIARATDRHQRARSNQPPDARLLGLSQNDMMMAEEAVKAGGHALKELIERSPGYVNSGFLDSRIHLVRAQAAFLRNEIEDAEASRKSAVAGLERELQRQPFRSDLALTFARFAGTDTPINKVLLVLARPLRFGAITEEMARTLQQLAESPQTQAAVAEVFASANTIPSPTTMATPGDLDWTPELLRMSAAMAFMRGDYEAAVSSLEVAQQHYASLPRPATLGEAASFLEIAEARFYSHPENPQLALEEAERAIQHAPHSRLGREFQAIVRQRMIQYHLASDNENEALRLLRESAPPGVTGEMIRGELGTRLRRLCESLLQRREAMLLRKPADSLMPRLDRWLKRAIELNPEDFAARFLAADLALHSGLDVDAAGHLREALKTGLNPEDAARFLEMALERFSESGPLKSLMQELEASGALAPDNKGP